MRLWPTAILIALLVSSPSSAQSLKPDEVFSSIAVQPMSAPDPVRAADGRVHLAHELLISNASKLYVTLDKVEILNEDGRSLWSVEDDRLAGLTLLYSGEGRMVAPGGTAIVFVDVALADRDPMPARLRARVTATRQMSGPDGKPAPLPKDYPMPASYTFVGAETRIGDAPAVVVAPPLKGKGWLAANGCCDSITSHRGAVMAVNGRLRVPERFAIDFVQLDPDGRLFTGDVSKLASYPFYGVPIYAAADGVVVNSYDAADEQVPGADAKGITAENIGGNMLVIDIGGGAYTFYAHLQPGSLRVKLGDQVKTGQELGLLGNTGNSDAPHLHFHVMDGPSPLDANGLPFVFTRFTGSGMIAPGSIQAILDGKAVGAAPKFTGAHSEKMPLNDQVVDFD